MNKHLLPIAILVASIILGGFLYLGQTHKQETIEKQQQRDITFANTLRCQGLLKELRERWLNVVGIYYSESQNTCIVKFNKDGEVQEGPIESMQYNFSRIPDWKP